MESDESTRLLQAAREDASADDLVTWDGPDDLENPTNWSPRKIWCHVTLVSLLTFMVPLGATMFAPAIQNVMQDLDSTNETLASLTVSVYILGWALGPLLLAPLSEVQGRLPVYTASNVLYVSFTVGCAVAPRVEVLVVFRFLAGAVGSTPLTIGGGTISDIVPVQRRGLAMSLFMFGPILGPSVGPLAGGYLTDTLGWRWIFWTIAIAYGCLTVTQILFMSETYAAAILERKARYLRKATGSPALRSALASGLSTRHVLARAITRPAKITAKSPVNALLSVASAYVNGVVFLLLTTAPVMFQAEYGFSPRGVGLAFVGYGAGNLVGLAAFTLTSDRYVRARAARGALRPEDRLLPGVVATPLLAAGLLWYGWSAAAHAHWGLAVAGSAVIGAANVLFFSAVVGYLIDAFGAYAASAIAANVVLRSIGGSLLPLVGRRLYAALGWGWGSSVLALLAMVCAPVLAYVFVRGEAIRAKHPVQLSS
ncbi:hypothetical protein ANO14919_060840 [Xylariales sp. No.14919]|nr:hypothetical protein ANO14919_060840 [Xylariales sp. No.14919]